MLEQSIRSILELKNELDRNESVLQTNLRVFAENLYQAFSTTISLLHQIDGSQNFFEVTSVQSQEIALGKLVLRVGDLELVFVPIPKSAIDSEAPYGASFSEQPTARILVFANSVGSSVFYSYWINQRGQWAGKGLGWMLSGQVDNIDQITEHSIAFLRDVFVSRKSTWLPLTQIALSDELKRGERIPIGFTITPAKDG